MSIERHDPKLVQLCLDWAHGSVCDNETAKVLADEIERMRAVIAHYTEAVDEGSRFSALVDLVPGLETEDFYPDRPPQRLVSAERLERMEAISRAYVEAFGEYSPEAHELIRSSVIKEARSFAEWEGDR